MSADGADGAGEGGGGRRGGWSLHVGSACAAPVQVSLRADAALDFALPFEQDTTFFISQVTFHRQSQLSLSTTPFSTEPSNHSHSYRGGRASELV